jgi:hypothetical protein
MKGILDGTKSILKSAWFAAMQNIGKSVGEAIHPFAPALSES